MTNNQPYAKKLKRRLDEMEIIGIDDAGSIRSLNMALSAVEEHEQKYPLSLQMETMNNICAKHGKPFSFTQAQIDSERRREAEKYGAPTIETHEPWMDEIIGHAADIGNCSACCFRNYGPICQKMICKDESGMPLFWTTKNTMEIDAGKFRDLVKKSNARKFVLEEERGAYLIKSVIRAGGENNR